MELTVLEKDQVTGSNYRTIMSDLALYYNNGCKQFYYWLKDSYEDVCPCFVVTSEEVHYFQQVFSLCKPTLQNSLRPVLKCNDEEMMGFIGKEEIELGFYPQEKVNDELGKKLEKNKDKLEKCKDVYTLPDPLAKSFMVTTGKTYLYEGTRYVRFPSILKVSGTWEQDYPKWFKVMPVKWQVDDSRNLLISSKVLVSKIAFNYDSKTYIYEDSDLKKYLDTYMSKEMFRIFSESILDTDKNVGDYFLGAKKKQLIKKGK